VLVHRHEQHRRIGHEGGLRPVAVVDVPIDDGDPADPARSRVRCRGRDIVEQAESHAAVRGRVVAGWAHEREPERSAIVEQCVDERESAAGCA
jgi:hypothetical protein